jgi:hypothetical protein
LFPLEEVALFFFQTYFSFRKSILLRLLSGCKQCAFYAIAAIIILQKTRFFSMITSPSHFQPIQILKTAKYSVHSLVSLYRRNIEPGKNTAILKHDVNKAISESPSGLRSMPTARTLQAKASTKP